VFAGGRFIGEAALTAPDFKPLTFQFDRGALPDPNAKNIEFRIEVPPWNPVAVPGKPADTRSLGVMIDRLAIQPAGQ
jgi:hypothetical protein